MRIRCWLLRKPGERHQGLYFHIQELHTFSHENHHFNLLIHYSHAANMTNQLYCICSYVSIILSHGRFDPYSKSGFAICRICKSSVHQAGSHYCQGCAYKKGTKSHCLPCRNATAGPKLWLLECIYCFQQILTKLPLCMIHRSIHRCSL